MSKMERLLWITILENLYLYFRIMPFGSPKIRAVKKEKKLYPWDWTMLEAMGFRFENMVASQFAVECKTGERAIAPSIHYFAQRTKILHFYQVHLGKREFETGNVSVLNFATLCKDLRMSCPMCQRRVRHLVAFN